MLLNLILKTLSKAINKIQPLLDFKGDYKSKMMDVKGKAEFVIQARDDILEYHKLLTEIKELREYLNFRPVFNIDQKLKQIDEVDMVMLSSS